MEQNIYIERERLNEAKELVKSLGESLWLTYSKNKN